HGGPSQRSTAHELSGPVAGRHSTAAAGFVRLGPTLYGGRDEQPWPGDRRGRERVRVRGRSLSPPRLVDGWGDPGSRCVASGWRPVGEFRRGRGVRVAKRPGAAVRVAGWWRHGGGRHEPARRDRGLEPHGGGRATRVHLERRRDDGPRARTPRRGGQHRDRGECAWRRARSKRNPAVSEKPGLIYYH